MPRRVLDTACSGNSPVCSGTDGPATPSLPATGKCTLSLILARGAEQNNFWFSLAQSYELFISFSDLVTTHLSMLPGEVPEPVWQVGWLLNMFSSSIGEKSYDKGVSILKLSILKIDSVMTQNLYLQWNSLGILGCNITPPHSGRYLSSTLQGCR